ncbi:serine/arginine repetitive matrix protein 3-like [Peromyscus leucopus]|uniref:serine/arginine repetitive matrix protein 3-like n=1 Tax=Peromyscus leucopus TaxID=10041 RepID=UPI0018858EA6|nr:serine/arginine repetitive matrix protein 3-like [Peromyscus leucopus]
MASFCECTNVTPARVNKFPIFPGTGAPQRPRACTLSCIWERGGRTPTIPQRKLGGARLMLKGWSGPGGRPRARSWRHKQGRRLRSSPHNEGAGPGEGRPTGAAEARPGRGPRSARLTSAMLAVHPAAQQRLREGAGRSLGAPAGPPPPHTAALGWARPGRPRQRRRGSARDPPALPGPPPAPPSRPPAYLWAESAPRTRPRLTRPVASCRRRRHRRRHGPRLHLSQRRDRRDTLGRRPRERARPAARLPCRRRRRPARPRARRARPLNTTHCGGRHERARAESPLGRGFPRPRRRRGGRRLRPARLPPYWFPAVAVGVGTLRLPELRPEHPREAAVRLRPFCGADGVCASPLPGPAAWSGRHDPTPGRREGRPSR